MKIKYIKKNDNKNDKSRNVFIYQKGKEEYKKDDCLNIELPEKIKLRSFIKFIRAIIVKAKAEKIGSITINYDELRNISIDGLDNFWKAKIVIENIILADYTFEVYKTKKNYTLKEAILVGDFLTEEKNGFKEGEIVATSANIARDMANTPGNDMTPSLLAESAKKIFKGISSVKVSIIEEAYARKLGMNLYIAVGKGSEEPSKLIIAEYYGGKKGEQPIVFIGKGITFDTGGLNLKLQSMEEMTRDMTGGAVVLSALRGIALSQTKKNVIAIVPAVENAISGSAYRPGDIIKSMEGITVEIGNTDAEGRLVIADAITYAKKFNPRILIDVATLTGASLVALGEKASVIMTKDTALQNLLMETGEMVGEYVWPLPVWDEYSEDIKSEYADILNTSTTGRNGGTITAGMFLYEFASKLKDCTWAHIDIAPRMVSIKSDNLVKGATGEPVKLLIELAKKV